jgi:hypothetical protein
LHFALNINYFIEKIMDEEQEVDKLMGGEEEEEIEFIPEEV